MLLAQEGFFFFVFQSFFLQPARSLSGIFFFFYLVLDKQKVPLSCMPSLLTIFN